MPMFPQFFSCVGVDKSSEHVTSAHDQEERVTRCRSSSRFAARFYIMREAATADAPEQVVVSSKKLD